MLAKHLLRLLRQLALHLGLSRQSIPLRQLRRDSQLQLRLSRLRLSLRATPLRLECQLLQLRQNQLRLSRQILLLPLLPSDLLSKR